MVEKNISKIVSDYKKKVKENLEVVEVYLFGSYAKGKYTEDSDIDIALVVDKDINYYDEQNVMRMRRSVDLRIEPHLFSKTNFEERNPFVEEIIRTGILY